MKATAFHRAWTLPLGVSVTVCALTGCGSSDVARPYYPGTPQVAPLGAISDATWSEQEQRAEASKFVVYDHEFKLRTARLNNAGEDHVKQIAAQLLSGTAFPVVVERSMNDNSQGKYHYPVNPNPELDNQRREVIVAALMQMGVADADQAVVVSPAFATPATAQEAEAAYLRGISSARSSGSFGGGFGGFGGGLGSGGVVMSDNPGTGGGDVFVGAPPTVDTGVNMSDASASP